jgi:dTDP-4-dehydrorhamnose reductase
MNVFDSVVITGGGGMLARALIDALATRDCKAIALNRAAVDITQQADVEKLFAEHRPTLLINCAAHTKVDLCEDEREKADAINGHAVDLLCAAAREQGTFLVHYSTDFVFDGAGTRPYRVDDPVGPLSAYGRSKLLGEQKLQASAPNQWLIVRTSWLYGRGGASFPRTIVERGRQGAPLKVVSDQIGSPTYTPDLAGATLDLIDRGKTGVWHVCNSGSTSWFDFARAALDEFNVPASVAPISTADWVAQRPKQAPRPAYSVMDIGPFARAVGRPMRPWRDALRDFRLAVERNGWA